VFLVKNKIKYYFIKNLKIITIHFIKIFGLIAL